MKRSTASPAALRRIAAQHLGSASPMRRGSLTARLVKCSRPGCPCKDRPEARHGPYYSLTRSIDGRTQSRLVPEEQAELVRRQIEDGRAFRDAVERHWVECERLADEQLNARADGSGTGAEKRGSARRSRRRLREKSKRS